MNPLRKVLLAGSQSVWLRERAMRSRIVRRSVSRFMPGERFEDAVAAARILQAQGVPTIFTRLGENLSALAEADEVTRHYLEAMHEIRRQGLDTQISVKLTQLGLDQSLDACVANTTALARAAEETGNFVWIDMESTPYVDPTLEVYRRVRAASLRVGVCLQAYLRRTAADVEALLPLGPAIRLVKGAYLEPPELAFPDKRDVDESFYTLAVRLLSDEARRAGSRLGIATHDPRLVARLQAVVRSEGIAPEHYEFEMLYGIQRSLQQQLVKDGWPLRVLISYGEYWFPWYMRRLAERPSNVLFVVKSIIRG